jgi:hypothetical protein
MLELRSAIWFERQLDSNGPANRPFKERSNAATWTPTDMPTNIEAEHRPRLTRIICAFLAAPLVGVIGGALAASLLPGFSTLGGLGYAFLLALVGAFYAYPLVLVVGVPLFLGLRRSGALSLWVFLVAGVFLGSAGWFIAASPVPSPEFHFRAVVEGVFGVASGLIGAATFWCIAVRNNSALTSMSNGRA